MFISLAKKAIFIHIYKVAGTSITQTLNHCEKRSFLSQLMGNIAQKRGCNFFPVPRDGLRPMIAYAEYRKSPQFSLNVNRINRFLTYLSSSYHLFPVHIRAHELQQQIPDQFYDSCYKFAFVRNPWDWQVSLYHYICKTPAHRDHRLVTQMQGFSPYIEWRVQEDCRLQKTYVTDETGQLIVDYVGKFETLAADFTYVCQKIGLNATLPHVNRSVHRPYTDYYTLQTTQLIAHHFGEDIEFFKYRFET